MNRRSAIVAGLMAALTPAFVKAQNQGTANDVQIVSTGNVQLDSAIGATQSVVTFDANGFPVPSQSVSSGIQVVSTGNVGVDNAVSADQSVYGVNNEGVSVDEPYCNPGQVLADPNSGNLYFCNANCMWVPVPCCASPQKRCRNC